MANAPSPISCTTPEYEAAASTNSASTVWLEVSGNVEEYNIRRAVGETILHERRAIEDLVLDAGFMQHGRKRAIVVGSSLYREGEQGLEDYITLDIDCTTGIASIRFPQRSANHRFDSDWPGRGGPRQPALHN